jgi:exodeoxyribonuclease VII large subunit
VPDRIVLAARLKELKTRMTAALQGWVLGAKEEISDLRDRLRPQRFLRKLEDKKQDITDLFDRLERAYSTRIEREHLLLGEMKTALESRSPRAVLARGYCVAERNGMVVKRAETIKQGDHMKIRFIDGSSQVIVERADYERDV